METEWSELTGGWKITTVEEEQGFLYYETADGKAAVITGAADGIIKVPEKLGGKPVTRIEGFAFTGVPGITEVILPAGLQEIGQMSFACNSELKSVMIPESVTVIKDCAIGYKYDCGKGQEDPEYRPEKIEGFVIYGKKGSAAEAYAKENGFEFVEKVQFVKGDVDLSGKVDISDLRLMLRSVCGKVQLDDAHIMAGDITGTTQDVPDGQVTIADLRKLLRFICGKIETL